MRFRMPSKPPQNRDPFRVLSTLFTVLACLSLFIGSLIISVLRLGDGNLSFFSLLTIKSPEDYADVETLLLLIP